MKNETLEEQLYRIGMITFFILLILGIIWYFVWKDSMGQRPCIFHTVTGLYCPGCGGTRAVLALLHGKIGQALYYHPFVVYGVGLYVCFMGSHTIARITRGKYIKGMKFHNYYLYIALGILIANFLVRNILKICFHITL